MRWLMVVLLVGETLGGPVAVPAPFPAGNFKGLYLLSGLQGWGSIFKAKMIIRQENEPNNGSVWRWGHNGFQKTFQCLFCSIIAFLISDSHFPSKKLLSVYGLLELGEEAEFIKGKGKSRRICYKFNGTPRQEGPKYFWHLTKQLFLPKIKTLMEFCEL